MKTTAADFWAFSCPWFAASQATALEDRVGSRTERSCHHSAAPGRDAPGRAAGAWQQIRALWNETAGPHLGNVQSVAPPVSRHYFP